MIDMAKRKQTPPQMNDATEPTPAQPRARRRSRAAGPETDTISSYPGVEGTEETQNSGRSTADERSGSMSMSSGPSEDDIRMRAYHRYLERGGGDGMDFADWLEAERELKPTR
jgi:Protein of unknown function (DUF2934)